jgi:hypothetical protein
MTSCYGNTSSEQKNVFMKNLFQSINQLNKREFKKTFLWFTKFSEIHNSLLNYAVKCTNIVINLINRLICVCSCNEGIGN